MSKKAKYFSFAIAIIAVATVMTIAIYAATTASAVMTASVSWTATAGIEFELEAWAVNNASQNGIGNTTVPKSITKQVVTTATTNQSASGLGGDLSCNFYDGTNDGVNNPSSIIFTYKITNTGDTVILIKATKTPNTASESGSTAADHKPAVALSTEIDGVVKGGAVAKVIGSEGYKIQPNSIFEYIVILSIASADINVQNFDAGVTFSMAVSSGVTELGIDREVLYTQNGQTVSGTTASGTATTYTCYGAYPQTYVGASMNSTLKSALEAGTLQATGHSYTTDSAINWTSNEVILNEYFYQDNFYACLEQGNPHSTSYTFSTGETIVKNEKYFFKVEPLKWTNHNGTYLCDTVIGSMAFDYTNYSTLWSESEVRTWLNDIFYEESGINAIKTSKSTIQNNTTAGETTDGAGTPTEDYVWLPSYYEMTTWFTTNEARRSDSTDLTKATWGYWYSNYSTTYYWLRSAYDDLSVCNVRNDGYGDFIYPDTLTHGIRPCFAL